MGLRRVLLLTAVLAVIVIAGVVLFFWFAGDVEPLLGSSTGTTGVS